MELFESYSRRIDKVTAALNLYDIKDLDEAKAICTAKN
ncbi:MAG: GGGtGRT protein, partial [Paludibacter sp.]